MGFPALSPVSIKPTNGEVCYSAQSQWDAVVVVSNSTEINIPVVQDIIKSAVQVDKAIASNASSVLIDSRIAGSRLVFAPTGSLDRDYDDVRRVADAARAGVLRAKAAGAVKPLLVLTGINLSGQYKYAIQVALLGVYQGLYEPLEARESLGEAKVEPIQQLGFVYDANNDAVDGDEIAKTVTAIEKGRRAARDIGGSNCERMTPLRVAEYCRAVFAENSDTVKIEVEDNVDTLQQQYPLLHAVARASIHVPRHRPCVIRLEYNHPDGGEQQTLLLAGKGVTYDTGGADIKAGGVMAGMSRDKGGAAAIAGFVKTVAELKTKGVRVVAELGMVRNSVGSDCFVSDEIITSHAGVRVRIANTDAEGRLVLADVLSHIREKAVTAVEPRLFTAATLTGHAIRAVGPYALCLDNGPAKAAGVSRALYDAGELWADPFEFSSVRREDYDFVRPRSSADDVLSCNNAASSVTVRGHQFPAAFIAIAAGLAKHGRDSEKPLPYTHLDIAGSTAENMDHQHGKVTGSPLVALTAAFILKCTQ